MELTLGQLIDRLITEQQKCWHAIDKQAELSRGASDVRTMPREQLEALGRAAQEAHRANNARVKLVAEIDQCLREAVRTGGAEVFVDHKSYEGLGE